MRNAHPGNCKDCGARVDAGAGYFHKQPRGTWPKWAVRCIPCVARGKQARGDDLSWAQQAAIKVGAFAPSERTAPSDATPEEASKTGGTR